jgi:tetratricopeptide (TPR) repeat protein
VKTSQTAIFLGVVLCGLVASRAASHAQSPVAPITIGGAIEGEDKPWNHGVPIATRQTARELFLEGNRLFYIPLYTRAAEKYLAALDRWKHPAFYFNLALTQLNLGQQAEAHDNLQRAIQQGEEPLGPLQFREARKQLDELEQQLGRIRVSCQTRGAEVTLDGATLFVAPGSHEVWVKASAHEITAKKAEYVTQARRVNVASGRLEAVDLPLRKLIEDRPWAPWKPWTVVGTGVAVAAASGVLHALSARNFSAYDDDFRKLSCASMGCTDQDVEDMNPHLPQLLSRAQLQQRLAVGGYIAGGVLIATGAALVYFNRPHLVEQGAANGPAVAIAPVLSADTVGVLVTVLH